MSAPPSGSRGSTSGVSANSRPLPTSISGCEIRLLRCPHDRSGCRISHCVPSAMRACAARRYVSPNLASIAMLLCRSAQRGLCSATTSLLRFGRHFFTVASTESEPACNRSSPPTCSRSRRAASSSESPLPVSKDWLASLTAATGDKDSNSHTGGSVPGRPMTQPCNRSSVETVGQRVVARPTRPPGPTQASSFSPLCVCRIRVSRGSTEKWCCVQRTPFLSAKTCSVK
mmetsp:Transcript_48405/g.122055  ORF Transcript_48405/g.122055 Transcript_48405/m.122055 type:complete len:229 (+) Transcript_48405:895-1581(+)